MRIVYLIVLILFTITNIYGQSAIKVSTEKVKVGDKTFYAHTVQKKETLHSLSKAYNVPIAEIIKNNESAAAGLKAGAVLLIPAKADVKDVKGNKDSKYQKHTVKWYEDITDISARYGVTVEEIMALNNLESSKLSPRQTLLIPHNKMQPSEVAATNATAATANAATETVTDADTAVADTTAEHKESLADKVKLRKFDEPVEIGFILPLGSTDTNRINNNVMDF